MSTKTIQEKLRIPAVGAMQVSMLRQNHDEHDGQNIKFENMNDPSGTTTVDARDLPATPEIVSATRPNYLQFAFEIITDKRSGSSLEAVQHLVADLNLPTELVGETHTILKFAEKPLSGHLRITQGSESNIYIHKDAEAITQEFPVTCEADLIAITRYIMHYQASFKSRSGVLKPVPKGDTKLLQILKDKRWDEERVPRFAEAQRAISRNNLLDATTELLAPFGLQPENVKNERVRIDLWPKVGSGEEYYPKAISIKRLDKYIIPPADETSESDSIFDDDSDSSFDSEEEKGFNPATAVMIRGLKPLEYNQAMEDRERQPLQMLRGNGHGSELTLGDLPKGLIYDLAIDSDVVAFVSRIVKGRTDVRNDYVLPFCTYLAQKGWDQKMEAHDLDYWEMVKGQQKQGARKVEARKTNLRVVISVEEIWEQEEAKRKRAEEEGRKAAKMAEERVWKTRNDAELDLLFAKSRRRSDESEEGGGGGKINWADWVGDDLETGEAWLSST